MVNKQPPLQQFNLLELGEPESPEVAIPAVATEDDAAMIPDADDMGTEIAIIAEVDANTSHSDPINDVANDKDTDNDIAEELVALNNDAPNDSDDFIADANEIINAPYGFCHCGAPILIPGLGAAKCLRCGWRGGY